MIPLMGDCCVDGNCALCEEAPTCGHSGCEQCWMCRGGSCVVNGAVADGRNPVTGAPARLCGMCGFVSTLAAGRWGQ